MNAQVSNDGLLAPLEQSIQSDGERLIVTWQHPESRKIEPVGVLSKTNDKYGFRYIANARKVKDFRWLLGFTDLDRIYTSDSLFPLFAQRAMDPKRPDFVRYVKTIGLQDDPTPWEQISASGGKRAGDTLQLFPVPRRVSKNSWECSFLVHGMRHIFTEELLIEDQLVRVTQTDLEQALSQLEPGEELQIKRNPNNPANQQARVITTQAGVPLGYLPDLLVDDFVQLSNMDIKCVAHTVNGPQAPWHMRLVATISGRSQAGYEFFSSPKCKLLGNEPS